MENIINSIGPFGKFQKLAAFLIGLLSALTSFTIYSTIFIAAQPKFQCSLKDKPHSVVNNECEIWENMNKKNYSAIYECFFDKTYYDHTIVVELLLVCDDKYLIGLTQSIFMIGSICGLFVGYFSDKYGRKRCLLVLTCFLSMVLIVCELLQTKSIFDFNRMTKYIIYCVAQFLIGAFSKSIYLVAYILLIELTTFKYSTIISNINLYMYVFGELVVLLIAYFFRDWHLLNWTMAIYSVFFIFIITFVLPESPRYLLAKGDSINANKVLKRIAKFNGKEIANFFINDPVSIESLIVNDNESSTNRSKEVEDEKKEIVKSTKKESVFAPRDNFIRTLTFFIYGLL